MKILRWQIMLAAIFLAAATLLAGCTSAGSVASLTAPADVLALAETPNLQDNNGEIVHAQWIFEELEGLSPHSQRPGFTRQTTDLWAETTSPWRYRFTTIVEPGGLAYDSGWNGERIWEYNVETSVQHALERQPEADELPSQPLDAARFAHPYPDLLAQAQQAPDRLRDLGTEEVAPWGTVHVIGYTWDGVTAQTSRYAGFPHTILFKITEAEHWLVAWADIIHTNSGDVTSREYRLTAWETLAPATVETNLWTFVPPESVILVDSLPDTEPATAASEQEPTRTIGEWQVPDYGFTPWVLGEMSTIKPTLSRVTAAHGQYILSYELNGEPAIVMAQGLELSEKWGNDPEIVELPWATVELGAIEPMGPPGWIALVRPHQDGDQPLPNISLLAEIPDRELVFQIVEALVLAAE